VLSDTSNFATGVPALTPWKLPGIVQVDVEVTCSSGRSTAATSAGRHDACASCVAYSTDLRAPDGSIAVSTLYREWRVRARACAAASPTLPFSEAGLPSGAGMHARDELVRRAATLYRAGLDPALADRDRPRHPLAGAANQILDSARARISMRTVRTWTARRAGEALVRAAEARAGGGAGSRPGSSLLAWWIDRARGPRRFESRAASPAQEYGRKRC